MAGSTATLIVNTGDGERRVALDAYLDAECAERAERDANAWIKSLRHVPVEGRPLRDRFLFRGDSLWWFAELYLHKRRVVADIFRTIYALDAMFARERPLALGVAEGDAIVVHLTRQCAEKRRLQWRGASPSRRDSLRRRLAPFLRGAFYTTTALVDRVKPARRPAARRRDVAVAAFVHSAFWRQAGGGDESYIGPVLREVSRLVGAGRLALVGLGPPTNFRSRTWKRRLAQFFASPAASLPFHTVASYASGPSLAQSARVWAERGANRDALLGSAALRAACVVGGCDAWPLLRDEFTGVTHLQFPWSARTMDEIGAALDALAPRVAITYAEAGGSGRALVLEARRRGIAVVGLQHGFIYRHWLNYLHEADEMLPSDGNPADTGFPRPDLTLLYDRLAAHHLIQEGRFPAENLCVSGSPKLDAFVETAKAMDGPARDALRASVGAAARKLAVVVTKYAQIAGTFDALIEAVAGMPDVQLVVKCHPAETAAPYERAAGGAVNVRVAPASADLARLVAVADVLITVNSTAAIEAMPLDVPALVVALPNNLSPFVEAGAAAGARTRAEIGPTLRAVLYDKEFQERLAQGRRAFMARYGIEADGRAAVRAAEAIVRLASA